MIGMAQITPAAGSQADQQFFAIADALSEESRRDIVADIVAHPKGLPSMKELEFTTGLHRSTIHGHLEALINAGVVEVSELPVGERTRDQPSKFYRITDAARDIFDRNNVFQEKHWREIYSRVDKPSEIKRAQEAPRPAKSTSQ